MKICPPQQNGTKSKGFTLVEIIVVVAVMVVLLAVLVPSLLRYTEQSRMQKDESAMDEVVNAFQLALADAETFDEAFSYSINNNYMIYTDSSGVYGAHYTDEEFWAPDGCGPGVTITFNPDENGNYVISDAAVNDMTSGNGSTAEPRVADGDLKQCDFSEMGQQKLYSRVRQSIGDVVTETSATYRNSSFTVFIEFDLVNSTRVVNIEGGYNGTNLSPDCPAAIVTGTEQYTPDSQPDEERPAGVTQTPNFTQSDLSGGGSINGDNSNPPHSPCSHDEWIASTTDETKHVCKECHIEQEHEYVDYKCTKCGAIQEHTCIYDSDDKCTICGEKKAINYAFLPADYDEKMGYTGTEMATATSANVVIPETFTALDGQKYIVTSLASYAFQNRTDLVSVVIPDSVTSLGYYPFNGCTALKDVKLSKNLQNIAYLSFCNCTSLENITIPSGVTKIYESAFHNCTSLTSIDIPYGVTTIGPYAFHGCTSLSSVTMPNSLTTIERAAFAYCSALTDVIIPDSVTKMNTEAFERCTSLVNVKISNGLKRIDTNVFSYCTSLTSIDIPNSVTRIDNAFYRCTSLQNVNIPNSVKYINGFYGCTSLRNITIPDSVIEIDLYTFGCSGLENITLSKNITQIDDKTFYQCENLVAIDIPDNVTRIGNDAFQNCYNLQSVNIPNSVESIGKNAFTYCHKLTDISYNGTKAQWAAITKERNWNFGRTPCVIHCTDGTV